MRSDEEIRKSISDSVLEIVRFVASKNESVAMINES